MTQRSPRTRFRMRKRRLERHRWMETLSDTRASCLALLSGQMPDCQPDPLEIGHIIHFTFFRNSSV